MGLMILSSQGKALPLANQLKSAGHDVAMWIKDPRFSTVGAGLVNVLPVWEPTSADLYLLDSLELTPLEPKLRAKGVNFLPLEEANKMMLEPSERWTRLAMANLPMPMTHVAYLHDIKNPPSEPSLVHFVRPFSKPKIIAPEQWNEVKRGFPADQEVAVVMVPEGPKYEALGLIHRSSFVEGSGVLILAGEGWAFSVPAPAGVVELMRALAAKMPPDYAGPMAIQLSLTDLGWLVVDFVLEFVWERLPLLMRSIKEDGLFVLQRLAKGNSFAVTSNGRFVFLQDIVAPPEFALDKSGHILPNLQRGLPGLYHPMNVYKREGFFKFAGTSRYIGSWTFTGGSIEEVLHHAALAAEKRSFIEEVLVKRLRAIPARELVQ